MTNFNRVLSKLAAVALLAAVVAFIGFFVVAPVVGYFTDRRDEIAEQRRLLSRLTAAGEPTTTAIQPKRGTDGEIFLAGNSDALRLAELQSLTGRIAELEGVELRSTRSLPVREREGLRLLGLEANMRTTIDQLQKVLYRIENGRPAIIVEDLQVTPPPLIADDSTGAGILDVRVNLLSAAVAKKG